MTRKGSISSSFISLRYVSKFNLLAAAVCSFLVNAAAMCDPISFKCMMTHLRLCSDLALGRSNLYRSSRLSHLAKCLRRVFCMMV